MEKTRKWRWGVNRWFVLLFLILGLFAARAYPPILPHVQLPAETLTGPLFTLPIVGPIHLTNTMMAIIIADVLLVVLALSVYRAIKGGAVVLLGVAGALEAALEALYELTESTAGKWAKRVFPWIGTIVLLVLVVNWMELIPGVDSIGFIHHTAEGHPVKVLGEVGNLDVITPIKEVPVEAGEPELYTVVPFVRVASTDLNFTVGLALISFFLIQVFGVWALGRSYFTKFFNVKSLFTNPFFGAIDFAVSLLEIVSEFSKIISFSFRLFGNIFAGSVLLFVIGTLVPVLAQTIFLLLEFLIGLMQALVFGMLTMIFISRATIGHGHEEGAH